MLGTGFALISTARPGAADEAALRRRDVAVLIAEADSPLAAWLHRGHATAALVRPDRTVARAGRDVTGVCAWTAAVLSARADQAGTGAAQRSPVSEPSAGPRC